MGLNILQAGAILFTQSIIYCRLPAKHDVAVACLKLNMEPFKNTQARWHEELQWRALMVLHADPKMSQRQLGARGLCKIYLVVAGFSRLGMLVTAVTTFHHSAG